jgi:hypothetical protein
VDRRHLNAHPLLPGLLVLVLSACSGGGEEVDPRQAFIEQASAICTEADEQFHALPQPTTPEQFGPYVEQTVTIAEQAQADLGELALPEDDRTELEAKVFRPFATLVDEGRAFAEQVAAAGTDQSKLLPLLSQRPTSAAIDLDYLASYGLPTCADAISQIG